MRAKRKEIKGKDTKPTKQAGGDVTEETVGLAAEAQTLLELSNFGSSERRWAVVRWAGGVGEVGWGEEKLEAAVLASA